MTWIAGSKVGGDGGAVIGSPLAGGTVGSVLFVGSGSMISQDNANLFWDDTDNRLSIGTTSDYGGKINILTSSTSEEGIIVRPFNGTSSTSALILQTHDGSNNIINIRKGAASNNIIAQFGIASSELQAVIDLVGDVFGANLLGFAGSSTLAYLEGTGYYPNFYLVRNIGTDLNEGDDIGVIGCGYYSNGSIGSVELIRFDADNNFSSSADIRICFASMVGSSAATRWTITPSGYWCSGDITGDAPLNADGIVVLTSGDAYGVPQLVLNTDQSNIYDHILMYNASGNIRHQFSGNGAVILNEDGEDADIRFEGDNDTDLFFLDASNDRIGISTNSPASTFDVAGSFQCDSINNDTGLAAGTYTPTRSSETNLDSNVTMSEAQYMRVGNTVTVSGRFTADPTTTSVATNFEITLPIASNIGAAEDVAGVAVCGAISGMCAAINGVVANDTAQIEWIASDVNSQTWSYTFTYSII